MYKQLHTSHRWFLAAFFFYIIAGAVLLLLMQKGDETIFFSQHHSYFLNKIFITLTQIAQLPGIAAFLVILLFINYRYAIVFSINLIVVGIVVGVMKHVLFADAMRPSVGVAQKFPLDFIEGIDKLQYFSFPSGHTAVAFAMCFMVSLLFRNTILSILLFLLALAIGISRMYLLQHYFEDIYVGSLVGMAVTIGVYWFGARSQLTIDN